MLVEKGLLSFMNAFTYPMPTSINHFMDLLSFSVLFASQAFHFNSLAYQWKCRVAGTVLWLQRWQDDAECDRRNDNREVWTGFGEAGHGQSATWDGGWVIPPVEKWQGEIRELNRQSYLLECALLCGPCYQRAIGWKQDISAFVSRDKTKPGDARRMIAKLTHGPNLSTI